MGPDAKPVKLGNTLPVSFTALDPASGVFENVYEGYSWYLASIAVARESGEGICFTAMGWQVNFI